MTLYEARVKEMQERLAKKIIELFIDKMIIEGILPKPNSFKVTFPPEPRVE